MNTLIIFITLISVLFTLIVILIVSLFIWNNQLNRTLNLKSKEMEEEHNKYTQIFEILTHDMGNLLNTVYNLVSLSVIKNGNYEEDESIFLLEESIFKIKFTRQLTAILSKKLSKKNFVSLKDFVKDVTSQYVLTHFAQQSPDFKFPPKYSEIHILSDENLEILFEYLMFQTLVQKKEQSEIQIKYSKEQKMIEFVFSVNLYDKFKYIDKIGGKEKVKSIERFFIEKSMELLGGVFFYSRDQFIIKLPYVTITSFEEE